MRSRHLIPLVALIALLSSGCGMGPRLKRVGTNALAGNVARAAATALFPFAGYRTRATLKGLDEQGRIGTFSGGAKFEKLAPNRFWFEQSEKPGDEFSFTSYLEVKNGKVVPREKPFKIVPQAMVFDGSSVPRFLWEVDSLGPFDFTLSALIHDWIYEAHHRWAIYKQALAVAEGENPLKEQAPPAVQKFYRAMVAKYEDYSTDKMPLEQASWIMAECIYREMLVAEEQLQFLNEAMENPELKAKTSIGNTRQGLVNLRDQVDIAVIRRHVLGYYRWAVNSFISKGVYDPKGSSSQPPGQSSHASTVTTIQEILAHGNSVRKKGGKDPAQLISPSLLAAFRRMRDEHTQAEAATINREGPVSEAKFREATTRAIQGGTLNEAAALEAASRMLQKFQLVEPQ